MLFYFQKGTPNRRPLLVVLADTHTQQSTAPTSHWTALSFELPIQEKQLSVPIKLNIRLKLPKHSNEVSNFQTSNTFH